MKTLFNINECMWYYYTYAPWYIICLFKFCLEVLCPVDRCDYQIHCLQHICWPSVSSDFFMLQHHFVLLFYPKRAVCDQQRDAFILIIDPIFINIQIFSLPGTLFTISWYRQKALKSFQPKHNILKLIVQSY